jgi:hypothetical protein
MRVFYPVLLELLENKNVDDQILVKKNERSITIKVLKKTSEWTLVQLIYDYYEEKNDKITLFTCVFQFYIEGLFIKKTYNSEQIEKILEKFFEPVIPTLFQKCLYVLKN